ncbi:MAG: NAD(P)H-hydrate epimerase [Thermoguttaceae bacterium]|nr:NAD(P)H-hydrate epimerase [Thermoguttaceae bacterium]
MNVLSRDTVRRLERTAIEDLGLPGLVLMENAARGITDIYLREFPLQPNEQTFIFCGTGNNAGDGLAVARQLQARNHPSRVFLCTDPARFRGEALVQYDVARKLKIPMESLFDAADVAEVLNPIAAQFPVFSCIDAMLGTGATGTPRAPMDAVIAWLNAHSPRTLAVDLPSGLDCETGLPSAAAVRASVTVSLTAAKPGLVLPEAAPYVGQLFVSDIGISLEELKKYEVEPH